MTPIAAYYIFTANEHERDAVAATGLDPRAGRPSLADRLRALVAALRPQRGLASAA